MIIMALDHTRDFFHSTALTADPLDASTTTPALYFTRWITHYCAPIFVFLSGLSAYLSSRNKTKAQASGFLIKRGLWLILVEITLVTFGLTFNPFFNFFILQVIWAIGFSMVILGLLMRISYQVVLIAGIVLFFGHNIVDYLNLPQDGVAGNLWSLFLTSSGRVIPIDSSHMIGVFYAILPWTGVMLMGYSIGKWFQKDFPAEKRKRLLLITGSSLILLFIILRYTKGIWQPGWLGWQESIFFSGYKQVSPIVAILLYDPGTWHPFFSAGRKRSCRMGPIRICIWQGAFLLLYSPFLPDTYFNGNNIFRHGSHNCPDQ